MVNVPILDAATVEAALSASVGASPARRTGASGSPTAGRAMTGSAGGSPRQCRTTPALRFALMQPRREPASGNAPPAHGAINHRLHERAVQAQRCQAPPMRSASRRSDRVLARADLRVRLATHRWRGGSAPCDHRGYLRRSRPARCVTRAVPPTKAAGCTTSPTRRTWWPRRASRRSPTGGTSPRPGSAPRPGEVGAQRRTDWLTGRARATSWDARRTNVSYCQ